MVYMYHSFLIHSSADGHLGCFHVLAMINSAAMNIGVHVQGYFQVAFFFFLKEGEQRNGMVARMEGRAKSFSSKIREIIVRLYVYGKE